MTDCIEPNDFQPSAIKPSDRLPLLFVLSDDIWRLPPRVGFSKKQLREVGNKHHKETFESVLQKVLILSIKCSAGVTRELLELLSSEQRLNSKKCLVYIYHHDKE